MATRGMVATPHYLASQAGLRLLQEGGTAVDAAVAAAAVLTVVYPHNTSLGGDLFALVHDPRRGAVEALNASGRAAARASIDLYRGAGYEVIPPRGPLAALTVPGAVDGWCELLERAGRKELGQVLQPAIEYAEQGHPVSSRLAEWLTTDRELLAASVSTARTYLQSDGRAPAQGELLRQPNLARSLRQLATSGRESFYRGELGERICEALAAVGSPLTLDDFAAHRSEWQQPISTRYRDQDVYQLGPSTQGVTALQILNIAEDWDLQALGDGSPDYYHLLVEATRQALRDRALISDPAFVDVPLERLLSKEYAARLRSEIDPRRAGPLNLAPAGGDTIYLCVADGDGLLVSLIQSVYWDFGSGVVAGDTGILLQNRGTFFSLDPAEPNRLEPGKRTFHTLIPAMLAADGQPWLAYGNMGGEGQPQSQAAIVTRIIDFGYELQAAIEAPRWLLGRAWGEPSTLLKLDQQVPAGVVEQLAGMGHAVEVLPPWSETLGHAQAVGVDRQRGILLGAADPRGDGAAVGF
jgi:oxamate amidohydrolase